VTQEIRQRLENMERELLELKRQQTEIVEASIKFMFELSTMVEKEKLEWITVTQNNKLDLY
jgi:hypothetical protein